MILSVTMKAALLISLLGLYLVVPETQGFLTCFYSSSQNIIRCGSVTCSTRTPTAPLPKGWYRVGEFYNRRNVPWFNLYPQRSSGGYWDYHTKSPDHSCRGGFGLHSGTISEGCITVGSDPCFDKLKKIIESHGTSSTRVAECRGCRWGLCLGGQSITTRTLYDLVWVRSL